MSHHCVDLNQSKGNGKSKFHKFAQRDLGSQHHRNARFTDVDRVPFQQSTSMGVDADINFKFETRLNPPIDQVCNLYCRGLVLWFQEILLSNYLIGKSRHGL